MIGLCLEVLERKLKLIDTYNWKDGQTVDRRTSSCVFGWGNSINAVWQTAALKTTALNRLIFYWVQKPNSWANTCHILWLNYCLEFKTIYRCGLWIIQNYFFSWAFRSQDVKNQTNCKKKKNKTKNKKFKSKWLPFT